MNNGNALVLNIGGFKIRAIIVRSGGQTGVDMCALDLALKLNIKTTGYCPKGYTNESGKINNIYHLIETDSVNPNVRTLKNVKYSDCTIIIINGRNDLSEGTLYTYEIAIELNRPVFLYDLSFNKLSDLINWYQKGNYNDINFAGPRASKSLNIYNKSKDLIYNFLKSILIER